jgi:hypothetical protein
VSVTRCDEEKRMGRTVLWLVSVINSESLARNNSTAEI